MEKEIKELKNIIIKLRKRISDLETPINNDSEHLFYSRDLLTNTYLVKCTKTGGNFSTGLWKNNVFPKNVCPCCGVDVWRKYGGKND